MHLNGSHCGGLVEQTAAALNEEAVMLMLLAVQRGNVELSVKLAWKRVQRLHTFKAEHVIQECLFAFLYIWLFDGGFDEFKEDDTEFFRSRY